jgi:hypothetical protein
MAEQISRDQFRSLFKEEGQAPTGDLDRRRQWMSLMQQPIEKEKIPLLDVGTQAVTNLIPSAIKYGTDIYEAVTSPRQTIDSLARWHKQE